jgi:hypothetical protein
LIFLRHCGQHPLHFGLAQDHRYLGLALRPFDFTDRTQRLMQHLAIEKNQCVQRLILRGHRHLFRRSQMRQENPHFRRAHFPRMPFGVK